MSPLAGEEIRFICEVVTRGTSTPLVVDVTSSIAEESGVVVPIPTLLFWASLLPDKKRRSETTPSVMNDIFFNGYDFIKDLFLNL